jgi:hypothetical protein
MKLRYWYKTDHNKHPIPGSNIRRKSRPGASHQWKELIPVCCNSQSIDCTCGPQYFVQVDRSGNPVDYSLIKRIEGGMPDGTDGMKFMEVQWKSPCCSSITYNFTNNTTGNFVVTVNGQIVVSKTVSNTGIVLANEGDTIVITLTNTGVGGFNTLTVVGGETYTSTLNPITTHTFIWNNKNTNITAVIDPTG